MSKLILLHIRLKSLHHEAFPPHNTYGLNIHCMSQLAQSSTLKHATYHFIKTHHIKMHNITQINQKEKIQVFRGTIPI